MRSVGRSRPLSSHIWSSRAGVGRRTQLDVQCGPGLTVQGVEVKAGLPPCLPDPGESLEQLPEFPIVGVGHDASGGQDHLVSLKLLVIFPS